MITTAFDARPALVVAELGHHGAARPAPDRTGAVPALPLPRTEASA
ncbi:hypothetical protein [Streptomyces sp. NPDC058614]